MHALNSVSINIIRFSAVLFMLSFLYLAAARLALLYRAAARAPLAVRLHVGQAV
jgi:hypothetical protein